MKFYYITNIFDLHIFDNETRALLIFFWNLHRNAFCFFIFLTDRNITNSLLTIHLKCTVVPYANLNSSFLKKPFLNCRPLNMLFRFFRFLIYVHFNEAFVKNFMKKLSFFNKNFQNSFQDIVYYRNIKM